MRAEEILGRGRYSKVTARDPYSVDKTYLRKWRRQRPDPYPAYVDAVLRQKLADSNPYFPRIYQVQSGDKPVYNMERLQPLTSLDDETLFALGERLIDDEWVNWENWRSFKKSDPKSWSGAHVITAPMNWVLHGQSPSHIRDPLLKQALLKIQQIAQQTNSNPDIHPENVMIRPTSVGPQIVLTDPLH